MDIEQIVINGVFYLAILFVVIRENLKFGFKNEVLIGAGNLLTSAIIFIIAIISINLIEFGGNVAMNYIKNKKSKV